MGIPHMYATREKKKHSRKTILALTKPQYTANNTQITIRDIYEISREALLMNVTRGRSGVRQRARARKRERENERQREGENE